MASTTKGGCLCGAVRYEFTGEPVSSAVCHCRECQYVSGGAPSQTVVVPRTSLRLTKGEPRVRQSLAESGAEVRRTFCVDCGTPLFAQSAAYPEVLAVKVGSLDDPSGFKPTLQLWTRSAQPWATFDPSIPQFETNPE